MIKSEIVNGHTIELKTNVESGFAGEIHINGIMVGCEAQSYESCERLYKELISDETGEKIKAVMEANDYCWDIDRYEFVPRYADCECGGTMTWCECCGMYSQNCCVDYGTCQCS